MRIVECLYDCYGIHDKTVETTSNNVLVLFSENISALSNVDDNVKVIMTIKPNLSSHFFNVLRFYCDANQLLLVVGSQEVLDYINGDKSLRFSNDSILVEDGSGCIVINKVENLSKFSDIIELNCTSFGICHRPNKTFSKEAGTRIAKSQSLDGFTATYSNGKVWNYYGIAFSAVVHHFVDDNFDEYGRILDSYLLVLRRIIGSEHINDAENEKAIFELYRYSPYVGYFLNVISAIVHRNSESIYNAITLEAAKKYNLNMSDDTALQVIEYLRYLLRKREECKILIKKITGVSCSSNYEVCLYIVSIMSDIRRRANGILQNGR